ncbi:MULTISPECIES: SRPBCC family protein [unclassified Streptomyces]|uniref:SRPBCC family protein n=1 Tax=unclassified Streptomyces TaxID=2593676 RepID=UPI000CD56F24|nr:SRPBCC family protein [Streptomyces sp. SM10]
MNTVEETIEVAVPVSTAYNQWTQFKSFPRFMTAVRKVEQIRPNLTRWVVGFGPVRHEFDAEIVDQRPDSLVAWRSLGQRLGHRGEVSFRETAPGRTELSVRISVRPHGSGDRLTRAPGFLSRAVRAELGHFKEFIEGLGWEGGAWRGTIRDGHVRPMEPEPARSRVPHWPVG